MSENALACSEMVWTTHKDHPGKGEFVLLHHPSFRKQAPWTQLQALFIETTERPPTFAHSTGNYRDDKVNCAFLLKPVFLLLLFWEVTYYYYFGRLII